MSHRFEDGPPCAPPRVRQSGIREIAAEPRFLVETGYQLSVTTHFARFVDALAHLIDHINDDQHPRLLGVDFDDTSSGLTDSEWAAVWTVYESRKPKARRA